MSDLTAAIPYRLPHDGPRRLLVVELKRGWVSGPVATVSLDGLGYTLPWGTHHFDIPADRTVHLAVHMHLKVPCGPASLLLAPGPEPVVLDYVGPAHPTKPGALGAPGTVVRQGRGMQMSLLGAALGLTLLLVALILTLTLFWALG